MATFQSIWGGSYGDVTVTITDLGGKLIQSNIYNESELLNLQLDGARGVYLIWIESAENNSIIRLVKE